MTKDLQSTANDALTRQDTSAEDGPALGHQVSEPDAADPLPQSPEAAKTNPREPSSVFSSSAERSALVGEPDTLPLTFCRNCNVDVKPVGKGKCPRCGKVLRFNFLARKHPVNKLRRQQLLDKLVAEYQPQTTMLQSSCEMLAGILEQLEVLKPGSTEHQRLVQLSQTLGAALEESRPRRKNSSASGPLENLSFEELGTRAARLEQQLAELRAGPLSAAESTTTSTTESPAPTVAAVSPSPIAPAVRGHQNVVPATPAVRKRTAAAAGASPESICVYCRQTLTRCAEIKGTRLDGWRALHYDDPEEVARRDKEATDVMLRQIGKPLPEWYR